MAAGYTTRQWYQDRFNIHTCSRSKYASIKREGNGRRKKRHEDVLCTICHDTLLFSILVRWCQKYSSMISPTVIIRLFITYGSAGSYLTQNYPYSQYYTLPGRIRYQRRDVYTYMHDIYICTYTCIFVVLNVSSSLLAFPITLFFSIIRRLGMKSVLVLLRGSTSRAFNI